MASALSSTLELALPSWNPLRCGGTALPVNLLIMAKAIAIALLLTNHVRLLPDPFLPFVPALDRIPPLLFQRTVQLVFIASAVTLIFNRSVRLSSFLLGMSIILSVVASKAYYGNNKTLCGFIFFLTSLYQPGQSPWMLRLQLVIVYFGAGLNKILDPDWRSGIFFENWAANRLHERMYLALVPLLPHLALAKLMSWFTILTELGLSGAFLIRRLYPAAPGAQSPRTAPWPGGAARTRAITWNSVPENTSEQSTMGMSNRMSGLSLPYRSIASAYVMRGNGAGTSIPIASRTAAAIIDSVRRMTSSIPTNDISMSIWVNSGCRSARPSSSRKHLTIWK